MAKRKGWRSRIVGHGEEAPGQLLANPRNWRIHPKAQQDAMTGALDEVGWVQDVIVNQRTGHLIDGHMRVSIAISREEASVPVVYVDLTKKEEALVLATLDPLAALAVTDAEQLAELVGEVQPKDEALAGMLEELVGKKPKPGRTDPDDVPEPADEPYVKRGELYVLGDHRLLCGDATSAEDVARLLDGATPQLTVTDAPYGVDYDPSWRRRYDPRWKYREGTSENDDSADWSKAWALAPSNVIYLWHGGLAAGFVQVWLEGAGFVTRTQIVWVKPALTFGRGAYHWRHEPCWYAVRKGAAAQWIGDRKQTSVWEIPNVHPTQGVTDDAITEHGAQKPVECMERPIRNHEGDVYDPFVGSGTTIIAAERQRRRCYAMDIDPRYVQVAIERWEAFTGGKADKLDAV